MQSTGAHGEGSRTSISVRRSELAVDDPVWLELDACGVAQFDPALSTIGVFTDSWDRGQDVGDLITWLHVRRAGETGDRD